MLKTKNTDERNQRPKKWKYLHDLKRNQIGWDGVKGWGENADNCN